MTVTAVDARKRFGELLNRVSLGHEDILILRDGKPVARLVPLQETFEEQDTLTDLLKARGSGKGVWPEDIDEYLRNERDTWS